MTSNWPAFSVHWTQFGACHDVNEASAVSVPSVWYDAPDFTMPPGIDLSVACVYVRPSALRSVPCNVPIAVKLLKL